MPQAGLRNYLLADRILLRRGQQILPDWRKILHPAVVHDRNRQDSLTTHAFIPDNGIVDRSRAIRRRCQ